MNLVITFIVILVVGWGLGKIFKPKTRLGRRMFGLLAFGIVAFIFVQGEIVLDAVFPQSTPTITPHPTATASRPPTITPNPCLHWDEVTTQMVGQTVCVYGVVSSAHANYEAGQTFIYFGTEDQFFITNELKWDGIKGQCVQAVGAIGLNTYRVPYINTSDLYHCE